MEQEKKGFSTQKYCFSFERYFIDALGAMALDFCFTDRRFDFGNGRKPVY